MPATILYNHDADEDMGIFMHTDTRTGIVWVIRHFEDDKEFEQNFIESYMLPLQYTILPI